MRILCSAALLLSATLSVAQLNIEFMGQLNYQTLRNSNLSNLWGYTDEFGNEYAIIGYCGTNAANPGGVSVVALGDGTDPQEIFFHPGPASIWREVKVWNDHAYITTEAENGGLTIVDLSPLPQSTDLPTTVWFGTGWNTSHALFIDENGRLYLYGSGRGNGGVIMYDLTVDPMNPVEVGEFDNWYAHDGYARGDTMYTGHIYDGCFSIVDVSNPASPVRFGRQVTPCEFTHNVWLDDSGQHLFTTDERTNAYVGSYNVSDPTDIQFLDKLRSDNGSGAIPHNTYWLDHFLVTSYYTYGVAIYDAMRPHNLVEVGHYDTSPFTGNGFNGAWGVYPYFDSQRLIISDMELGLFVLDPTYVRACWLEGTVRNAQTGVPVNNATVELQGIITADPTGLGGTYATGYHTGGTYTVVASAPGFEPATITGVVLENGQVTFLDIDLVPLVAFTVQGMVVEAGTGTPIAGATVSKRSDIYAYEAVSGTDGSFQVSNVFSDNYELVAGRWGWRTVCLDAQPIDPSSGMLTIELEPGYYDDFFFDFEWTVETTATLGAWERGAPVGTTFQGAWSNPPADADGDCGDQAYVTGNGGGAAGADDVDDGHTILISPLFDATGLWVPTVKYHRWFFNAGGASTPNDRMTISLDNGTDQVVIENITTSASAWVPVERVVSDYLTPTETMRIIVFITDDNPGHLVEGGFDRFELVEGSPVSVPELAVDSLFRLWPNPSEGQFTVALPAPVDATVELLDALGREVAAPQRVMQGLGVVNADVPSGAYLVRVTTDEGQRMVQRLVVKR